MDLVEFNIRSKGGGRVSSAGPGADCCESGMRSVVSENAGIGGRGEVCRSPGGAFSLLLLVGKPASCVWNEEGKDDCCEVNVWASSGGILGIGKSLWTI